jgi:hypothetical protein
MTKDTWLALGAILLLLVLAWYVSLAYLVLAVWVVVGGEMRHRH